MWNHYFLIIFFPTLTPKAGNLNLSNQAHKSEIISYHFQGTLDQCQITIIMFIAIRLLIYFFISKVLKKYI